MVTAVCYQAALAAYIVTSGCQNLVDHQLGVKGIFGKRVPS
jgi:hypothetical protein